MASEYSPINLNRTTLSQIKDIMKKEGFKTMAQAARHAINLFYEREYKHKLEEEAAVEIKETKDSESLFKIRKYLDHEVFKYIYKEFKTFKFKYNYGGTNTTIKILEESPFRDCNGIFLAVGDSATSTILLVIDPKNRICHLYDGGFSLAGGTGGGGFEECMRLFLKKGIDFRFISLKNKPEEYIWALYHYGQLLKLKGIQPSIFTELDFENIAGKIARNTILINEIPLNQLYEFVKYPEKDKKQADKIIRKLKKHINHPLKNAEEIEGSMTAFVLKLRKLKEDNP